MKNMGLDISREQTKMTFIPKKIKYNIYNSLVKSLLNYLTGKDNIPKTKHDLEVKENELVKILFHCHYHISITTHR